MIFRDYFPTNKGRESLLTALLVDTMPSSTRHPVRNIDASIALPSSANSEI